VSKKPKSESLAGYVSKNVYDGKRVMTPAEADEARRAVDANRDILRVGRDQLERYDEALRELAGETSAKRDDGDDA
jgi:hypothetical protein